MTKYYDLLGISETASSEAVDAAWRAKTREHYPDSGGDEAAYEMVLDAGKVLRDAEKRATYNHLGHHAFIERYGPRGNRREIDPADAKSTTSTETSSSASGSTDTASRTEENAGSASSRSGESRSADSTDTADTSSASSASASTSSSTSSASSSSTSDSATGSAGNTTAKSSTGTSSGSGSGSNGHNYRSSSRSTSTSSPNSKQTTRSEYRREKKQKTHVQKERNHGLFSGWIRADVTSMLREVSAAVVSLLVGLILSPMFILVGFVLALLVIIVNTVLGIFIWLGDVVGLLSGSPIPNGVLPDPYFTYVLELATFAVILAGSGLLLLFVLKPLEADEYAVLSWELPIPTLTALVPTSTLAILYAVHVEVPVLTAAVSPHAASLSPVSLALATMLASLAVTNRARRLVSETVIPSTRLGGRGGPSKTFEPLSIFLGVALDIATLLSISGFGVWGYWQGMEYLVPMILGGDTPLSELAELVPHVDLLVTGLPTIAIAALVVGVLYRIACTVYEHAP